MLKRVIPISFAKIKTPKIIKQETSENLHTSVFFHIFLQIISVVISFFKYRVSHVICQDNLLENKHLLKEAYIQKPIDF